MASVNERVNAVLRAALGSRTTVAAGIPAANAAGNAWIRAQVGRGTVQEPDLTATATPTAAPATNAGAGTTQPGGGGRRDMNYWIRKAAGRIR